MKKALSGVIAASLVMSSFASVAFAAETTEAPKTPKTPEEMFEVLKTAGVFEGFEDGTAGLDKSMTRAQVAKVLVKLLKLEENKAGASVYQDLDGAGWAEGFIGAATKAGIMDGVADGKFDPSGTFTTEQLAAVLVRALKLPLSTEAAEGVVADWAKAYVATAVKAGLITKTADYTKPALRSVLVTSSFAAKGELDKPVVVPQAITAEIKGYETVLVKFGAAADTSKVKFELKKGATTKAHKVTWNEAKTEATLALDSKLTEGEYGLSVTGASEAAYTQTFKVEAEKVVSIKFDSDKAPLGRIKSGKDVGDSDDQKVSFTFKALNQFGEDISDKIDLDDIDLSLSSKKFEASQDDNKINIDVIAADEEFNVNDTFRVRLTYDADNIFAEQQYTVAEEAYVANIKNAVLYNEDGDTLDTSSELGTVANDVFTEGDDPFYVSFEAIDQYGNEIDADDYVLVREDVKASSTEDNVAEADEVTINKKEINDSDTLVLPLYQSDKDGIEEGKTTITLTAERSGNKATVDVTAKEVDKVATFTLSTPEIVVAGEENIIPFTALDTEGKDITDLDVLNNEDADNNGDNGNWEEELSFDIDGVGEDTAKLKFEKNANGKIELILDLRNYKLDESDDEEDSLTDHTTGKIEGTTFTGKDISFDIKVKEKAVPLDIVKVSPDEGALAVNGEGQAIASTSFGRGDIKVIDQYDREEDLDDKKFDGYTVKIVKAGGQYVNLAVDGSDFELEVAGTKTGKEDLEMALVDSAELLDGKYLEDETSRVIEDSNYKFTMSAVDVDDIVGYNVEEFTELYATEDNDGTNNPYAKELEVVGLLKDGTEVALPQTSYEEYYTVSIPNELKQVTVNNAVYGTIYADASTAKEFDIEADVNTGVGDKTAADIEVNVIGKTTSGTKEYTRKIAVSTHKPKVVTQALDDDDAVSKEGDGVVSIDYADYTTANTYNTKIENVVKDAVKSTDQYGFEILDGKTKDGRPAGDEIAANGGVVFTNLTDKDRDTDAEVKAGDDLQVTVTAPSGKKFTFKLHIN